MRRELGGRLESRLPIKIPLPAQKGGAWPLPSSRFALASAKEKPSAHGNAAQVQSSSAQGAPSWSTRSARAHLYTPLLIWG